MLNLGDLGLSASDQLGFRIRDGKVVHTDRRTRARGVLIAGVHQLVSKDDRRLKTHCAVALVDHPRDGFFHHRLVDHVKGQTCGHDVPQQRTSDSCLDDARLLGGLFTQIHQNLMDAHLDPRMQLNPTTTIGALHLFSIGEGHALALRVNAIAGHVVKTQYHVLRRHDDRVT